MAAELQRPPPTALIAYLEKSNPFTKPSTLGYNPYQYDTYEREIRAIISELEHLPKLEQILRFKQIIVTPPHTLHEVIIRSQTGGITLQYLKPFLEVINSCLAGSQLSLFELQNALKVVSQNNFTPERGMPITSVYNFLYNSGKNGASFVIIDSENKLRGIMHPDLSRGIIECKHQGFTISDSHSLTADEIADSDARRFLQLTLPSGIIIVIKPDLTNPLFYTKIYSLREVEPVLKYTTEDYFEARKRGSYPMIQHRSHYGVTTVHAPPTARCEQTEPTPVFELVPLSVKELNDMLPLIDGRPRATPVAEGVASLAANPADLSAPLAAAVPFTPAEARREGGTKRRKKNRKSRKNNH
jgi:hypothetical protein